jgi:undecaprenyl phosphate-alpha-L-ara4N flippase subunit ArnE
MNGKVIYLCFGFFLYGTGSIIMITAYKYGSVSTLQPVLSIGYVFSLIIAAVVLGETITICKLIGIVIITLSVVLIGNSGN